MSSSTETSIDDRREAAKEKILKQIRDSEDPEKAKEEFVHTVAQAVGGVAKRVPYSHSVMTRDGDAPHKRLKRASVAIPDDAFADVPDIVKRTPEQRLESMTDRLVREYRKDPSTIDKLLKEIQSELLRQRGYDMTGLEYQDLRKVAQYFLERAEQIAKDKKAVHTKHGG